jgi:hypothetical protein
MATASRGLGMDGCLVSAPGLATTEILSENGVTLQGET